MSQENVEVVQRFFDAVNDGDIRAELQHFDPSIEFDWSASKSPYSGRYHGREQVARWMEGVMNTWEALRFEPQRYTEVGDSHVVVSNRVRTVGRMSGLETVAEGAQVWSFEGGRAIEVRLYQSEREALEAVGLSE